MDAYRENPANEAYINQHLKVNYFLSTFDGGFYILGMVLISLNTIFPVFLRRLGASNFIISCIPFINIIGMSIPQLLSAQYVQKLERKKPYLIVVGFLQRIPWLFIGMGCFFLGANNKEILILLTLIMLVMFCVNSGLAGLAWFDLFSKVTPTHIRGRLLSTRNVVGKLLGIPATILATVIIGKVKYPNNYALLFLVAYLFVMLSYIFFVSIREPADEIEKDERNFSRFFKDMLKILKDNKDFRYYVISISLWQLSLATTAFYTVYAINHFKLSDSYAGVFSTVISVAFIMVSFGVAFIADRKGHKITIMIGQIASISTAVLAILINNLYLFYIVFVITAIIQSVQGISISNLTIEFCKFNERATYLALSNLIMIPVSLFILAMGSVADWLGIKYLFGISAVISTISFGVLYLKVNNPRKE